MIEIEYGNELWKRDTEAANAEAVRRACLLRDAEDAEDRREIFFSDLGALTILPQELAEIDGLQRLIVGDAETPGGRFYPTQHFQNVDVVAKLSTLVELNLRFCVLKELPDLSYLQNLQKLDLTHTRIDHVFGLNGLTSLISLSLAGTDVRDVNSLGGLTSLKSLDLTDTNVDNISVLRGLSLLHSLFLSDTYVDDINVLLSLSRYVALDAHSLSISRTPLAQKDRHWEMLAGLSQERQATDIVLYLQGKHPDLQPPEEGASRPTGPAAILTRSPITIIEQDGLAEVEDSQDKAALPPVLLADHTDQIKTVHALAQGMVEGLELGANVPPLLLQRLKWYRDVADPASRPVLNVLESVMVVLRGTIADAYMRAQMDEGTCAGLDHLVLMHDDIGVPPAIEDPRPVLPHVPETAPAQTEVIEQVKALQHTIRDLSAAGLTGNTITLAINSTVDVVNTANSPTIHTLSSEEKKEREGLWAWGLRMAAGMSQGLETYGKIHGWSTTPMGAALLQRLADIVQKLLPYFM